jgi:hypothetical protein
MAIQAWSGVFDGFFDLSYKFGALGLTQFLGLRTEGDNYRRFIPLMNVTPAWEPVVSLLASAFYLAAMVQVLRRRRSATGLERKMASRARVTAECANQSGFEDFY